MDSTLFAGMLSALQSFSKELSNQTLEELELQKFQIFLISSSDYPVNYALITNGGATKNHAQDTLNSLVDYFERENSEALLNENLGLQNLESGHQVADMIRMLFDSNSYLNKIIGIRQEFFGGKDTSKKKKKDELRKDFF